MRLLHVIATPRGESSNTLHVSRPFLETLRTASPGLEVETLDLFAVDLPALAGANSRSKYAILTGAAPAPDDRQPWADVERLIAQFQRADVCLVSTPMWNFHVPHVLKHWIDSIVQPGYTYAYNEHGVPEGRCAGTRVVCITSRGGDYSASGPLRDLDLQNGYLQAIFGFIGTGAVDFVNAQPMDLSPGLRVAALDRAVTEARMLAARLASEAEPIVAAG